MDLKSFWKALEDSPVLAMHAALYDWAGKQLPPGLALELGCEYGFGTVLLESANPQLRLIGVDFDWSKLRAAGEVLYKYKLITACAAAENLPFASASFSSITMINLLHLIPDPIPVLLECWRMLNADGAAVIALALEPAEIWESGMADRLEALVREVFSVCVAPTSISGRLPGLGEMQISLVPQSSVWAVVVMKTEKFQSKH